MQKPKDMVEFVELMKEQVSLKDIIGSRVNLIPNGPNKYRGLSPFKQEKTPSFYVDDNPDKRFWYCQATKQGGGLLQFLTNVEGMSKPEAIRYISLTYNIPLPEGEKKVSKEDDLIAETKASMYLCFKAAQRYFRSYKTEAIQYIKSKGYPEEIVDAYDIGFAPDSWDELKNQLIIEGFSEDIIMKCGLAFKRKDGKGIVNRYRSRVMFPIYDTYGQIIGYTGRDITDTSDQKYLHVPNSLIFKRENVVWNYSKARKAIQEQKRVFVGEGNFDAIMADYNGFPAVCTLGSSISSKQLSIITPVVENLYMMFDPDEAGKEGLWGLFKKVEDSHIDVVVFIVNVPRSPGVKDVADYIRVNGDAAFSRIVESAQSDTSFVIEYMREKHGGPKVTPAALSRRVLEEISPFIKKDQFTYRSLDLIDRLTQSLNLDRQELLGWVNKGTDFRHNSTVYSKIKAITFPGEIYERRIMTECMKDHTNWSKLKSMGISTMDFSYLVSKVLTVVESNPRSFMAALETALSTEEHELVMSAYTQSFSENLDINTLGSIVLVKMKKLRDSTLQSNVLGRPLRRNKRTVMSSLSKLKN